MSRPLRIEFEGALYHITARGDRREPIFEDDTDRSVLLATIEQAFERFDAIAFAYCLMSNHYHLVVETHRGNLSRLMRHVNGVYTQAYNRRHAAVGHLFQGRFKAILVQREAYFLEVCRYVDLNPVRARMVDRPEDWVWSSYRAHIGRAEKPGWLNSALLHQRLTSGSTHYDGAQAYACFVWMGLGSKLWGDALSGQIYLGDEAFMRATQQRTVTRHDPEIPRAHRKSPGPSLQHYLNVQDRDMAIARAYLEGGYTQTAISKATGLSVSRVSRLIAAYEAKGKT